MNGNNVQSLSSEAWSSEIDFITIEEATPYNRKTYFNRYAFIAQRVVATYQRGILCPKDTPLTIIDAACGDGTGSAFLAEQFPLAKVIGIDLNKPQIDHAVEAYAHRFPNVEYRQCNLLDIDMTADIFCCMETLEHLKNETMHAALAKISNDVLLQGGRLVASSPRLRPRETTKKRPGHINELYYQQFRYVLGEYFPMTEFFSMDRYGNLVPDTTDANLMIGICYKFPATNVFND